MNSVQYWPLDVDTLSKGDVISIDRLEEITGKTRTDQRWALYVLRVKSAIESQLVRTGRVLTLRMSQGQLVVCVDNDASVYNENEVERGLRKMARAHQRNLAVDVLRLDEERKPSHERTLLVHGRMILAASSARRDPELKAAERVTPGLPSKTGDTK